MFELLGNASAICRSCSMQFHTSEAFLCLVADMSPALGAIPPSLQEVVVQCYRRFNRLSSNLCDERYIRLHVLMDELGMIYLGLETSLRMHSKLQERPTLETTAFDGIMRRNGRTGSCYSVLF